MIKKIFSLLSGIEKYLVLVFFGVIVIYEVNIVGVELFKINPQITYIIASGLNIILGYFGNLYIFKQKPSKKNSVKYIFYLFMFFAANNLLFMFWIKFFNIHYLIAIAFNALFIPLAKFLSYKFLVFSPGKEQPLEM
jgi:hypothetical protein